VKQIWKLCGYDSAVLERMLRAAYPLAPAMSKARAQMLPWQMVALYGLTLDWRPRRILEVGAGLGTSAWMMAQAQRTAEIVTLSINPTEATLAQRLLNSVGAQARVEVCASVDYYRLHNYERWDLIYIDGDHRACCADLPWFNSLNPGGLMLFHDYSPAICPPVYEAVSALAMVSGGVLDVELIDADGIGMAGVVRQEGEEWLA